MKIQNRMGWIGALCVALAGVAGFGACGSDDTPMATTSAGGTSAAGGNAAAGAPAAGGSATTEVSANTTRLTADAQTPPSTNAADVDAWLAKGDYKKWHCEAEAHDAKTPSPHNQNRICSNDLVFNFKGAVSDERPVGSASVKELWDTGKTKIVGYAVYVKTVAASSGGSGWYWYEKVPADSPALHDANGVVADGFGDTGAAKTICVSCHTASGTDAAHITSTHSSDYVYTQVSQLNDLFCLRPKPFGLSDVI